MRRPCAIAAVAALSVACGGGSQTSPSSTSGNSSSNNPFGLPAGTIAFHAAPVAPETIRFITPLGNLNPPGHTTPTDHIYFYFADPNAGEQPAARRTTVFVPESGTVSFLIGGQGTESKVMVSVTSNMWYYLDHVIPDIPVAVGTKVTAGQRLGTTGLAYAMDLGLINFDARPPGILSPARYTDETVHGDAPLKYFVEPIRSQLYAKVQRLGTDLEGRFDYDVPGRLIGNWFYELGGTSAISFALNTYDPSQVRIALGGIPSTGVYSTAAGDPAPANVSVASGLVKYVLTSSRTGPPLMFGDTPVGTLLVQMLTDQRIQVEMFFGSLSANAFTGNAKFFIR